MTDKRSDPVRPADDEARALARRLLRTARHGALAVLDPQTGFPMVSRTGLATMVDGTPIILVSTLAAHTAGLAADSRCSLLVGEPGKGDPLAHPRMTIACHARKPGRQSTVEEEARSRYLAANPKAALYAGFADFAFHLMLPQAISLNGGFGRAYRLRSSDLLCDPDSSARFAGAQSGLLAWLNGEGRPTFENAARAAMSSNRPVKATGVDPTGIDIVVGQLADRLDFIAPASDPAHVGTLLSRISTAS